MSSEFFSKLLRSASNFEHFEKQVTLIADVFTKLKTERNVVT